MGHLCHCGSMTEQDEAFFEEDIAAENIYTMAGIKPEGDCSTPMRDAINTVLKAVDPNEIQDLIVAIIRDVIKWFTFAKIDNKYWQIIMDGTQIISTDSKLQGKHLFRVHNAGKENEWVESLYYVLEAKIYFGPNMCFSVMSIFVENDTFDNTELNEEERKFQKQQCESKAGKLMLEKLDKNYGDLGICICADALYANGGFLAALAEYPHFKFLIRYKKGCAKTIEDEFEKIRKKNGTQFRKRIPNKDIDAEYDYACGVTYNQTKEKRTFTFNMIMMIHPNYEHPYYYITNLEVRKDNVVYLIERGRNRWCIEDMFKDQKKHGFNLEHLYSKNNNAMKCHYLILQIAHMISLLYERYDNVWAKLSQAKKTKRYQHNKLRKSLTTHLIVNSSLYKAIHDGASIEVTFTDRGVYFTVA